MREREPVWLNPFSGGFVILSSEFWQRMTEYNQDNQASSEAGGIFIGRYRGAHIEITDLTVPMPMDERGTYSFLRQDLGHIDQVNKA